MDDKRAPAHRGVGGEGFHVAGAVAGDLGAPIVGVGLRHARAARAIVPVPEAAVDENREPARAVDDVGLARQIGAMEPVARRDRAQKLAHRELRTGVARFDRAHDRGAVIGHSIAHAAAPRVNRRPCRPRPRSPSQATADDIFAAARRCAWIARRFPSSSLPRGNARRFDYNVRPAEAGEARGHFFSAISASDITWTFCNGSGGLARSVRDFGTLPFINADLALNAWNSSSSRAPISALSSDRISPDPRNFPHIDLTICDDVASCRREMTVHTGADAVDRLPHIDRHLIEIAKYVAADFVCQGANRSSDGRADRSPCLTPRRSTRQRSLLIREGSSTCSAICRTTGTHTPSPQT